MPSTDSPCISRSTTSRLRERLHRWPGANAPTASSSRAMDSVDERRSPSLPTAPTATSVPSISLSIPLLLAVPDPTMSCPQKPGAAHSLGLTPRQHATGGKERLLGISKRGDGYLRLQLMHGARSLVRVAKGRSGQPWAWINELLARRPFNVVVAAVANKLARIIWAMLSRSEAYRATA